MNLDEERDFTEKVIRLRYKCAKELHISTEDIVSATFIKWLVDKISKEEEGGDHATPNVPV